MKGKLISVGKVCWAGLRAVVALQHGIVGLLALAVGLAWQEHDGWPLVVFGGALTMLLFGMNARGYVLHEQRRVKEETDRTEHVEVVKLEYEHAVRAAKLGTGTPLDVVHAGAHAQAHGVTADELQEIAERVHKSKDTAEGPDASS